MYIQLYMQNVSIDQSLTADSLGATDLFDYTGRVLELISGSVQSGRDTAQCCGYRYQMLDKYCTSRTAVCTYQWNTCAQITEGIGRLHDPQIDLGIYN